MDTIIRIGSAGALRDDLKLMDIVAAQGACTDSNFVHQFELNGTSLHRRLHAFKHRRRSCKGHGVDIKVGNILSGDNFYSPAGCDSNDKWRDMGVMACEMEAADFT